MNVYTYQGAVHSEYKSDAQCNHVNLGVLYNDPLITVSCTRYMLYDVCHSSTRYKRCTSCVGLYICMNTWRIVQSLVS